MVLVEDSVSLYLKMTYAKALLFRILETEKYLNRYIINSISYYLFFKQVV